MNATASAPARFVQGNSSLARAAKLVGWSAVLLAAVFFVFRYVFRYYLNYNEAAFTDPLRGAANYWRMRGWLMLHISSGMLALLTGPWQFWTGFRARYFRLHRWMGRAFLVSVALGSVAAVRLAFGTTFGWALGASLCGLALAWITTAGMAYSAILQRRIAVHKEWMVRAYVVTFAFVIFRLMSDYSPMSRLEPVGERFVVISWASWAIPLLFTEVLLQLRRMRSAAPRGTVI
jgi:hypothetical protein